MLSEELILIMEMTGFYIRLHYKYSITMFFKLHKTINFIIKQNIVISSFFNHKNNSELETLNWINTPLCIWAV